MKIKSSFVPWVLAFGFAFLFFATLLYKSSPPQTLTPPLQKNEEGQKAQENAEGAGESTVLVTKVVDGDTIEIKGGIRVRYIGIDTPESGQCGGEEATRENSQLVENKKVTLETDVQKLDRYGRTLAYVFIDGVFVNEELLKRGVATVTTYPPNVKYVDRFLKAQEEARGQKKGTWAEEFCASVQGDPLINSNTSEKQTSNVQGDPSNSQLRSQCVIKGNISSSGEKIYHTPGQRYYERTKIEEVKGERWFCTEDEALKAGWRKSKV